ncbi:ABC transporter permease [Paludibacterium yongneupense]|uniref:ABC transporter permease n=1 Tax=Paludibacterium yongneupense TaxID=400061 RepID=UPI00040A0935|nr:iron ABC transporter permease [Paludibacterium yongneupense]
MRAERRERRWLYLPPLVFLLLVALAPAARLLLESGARFSVLSDAYLRWRLLWSLGQAALTCVLGTLIGVPVAWVLARTAFPGRALVLRVLMLPFVMPTLVAGIGVLAVFGPHGLFGADLQDTPWLLLYGNLFYNLPLIIRGAHDGFAALPASRLAAARTLGATRLGAFWRVEWPAMLPALGASLCLVFLFCFSGFGLALLLGGVRYATVEVEIYSLVAYELNLADASALALMALTLSGVCVLIYAWFERRLAHPAPVDPLPPAPPRHWQERVALALALGALFFFGGLPLAAVAWRAASAGAAWRVLFEPDTLAALGNTARFSAMTLVLATVLGVMHAMAGRARVWMRAAAFLPYVISPVCMAFGLLLLYPGLSASLGLLIAAYTLLAYPFVAKGIGSALDRMPPTMVQAARTLGASPPRVLWRVTLPLLRPALRRGMAFAAASAVGEFAVTLFLSRPEWTTLTTLIYRHLGRPGAANLDQALVLASLLMGFALLAFLLIEWPSHARRESGG